jgi:alpha-glucoside transport system permease protein
MDEVTEGVTRMTSAGVAAEPPVRGAPPPPAAADMPDTRQGWRRHLITLAFLGPAVFFLAVWIVYPTVYTIVRSFLDQTGSKFVGIDNYKTLFTTDVLVTAIKNNAIWVAVVPATVTAIGLVFAVLTERVRWSVAFKTAVFMPMAISLFAAGVIWHLMYLQDPSQGAVNAAIAAADRVINPPGPYSGASPSSSALKGSPSKGFTLQQPLQPGGVALMGLTAVPPEDIPTGAVQAVKPQSSAGAISGVVWRDFKPGGGTPGKLEKGETGLPDVKVDLTDSSGKTVASTTTANDGTFAFSNLSSGTYETTIDSATFAAPFAGVPWLGTALITPSIIIAYIWVWAGFSMVVIGAGLAAIPRDVLEAARTDGASEWQVFRRVTVPLLAPVLSVVFITMIINVLKVFDIILSIAPGSSQTAANVIALAMWRTSFGGTNDFGLGSAIAVFLFILVIPVLLLNVRRFKREV